MPCRGNSRKPGIAVITKVHWRIECIFDDLDSWWGGGTGHWFNLVPFVIYYYRLIPKLFSMEKISFYQFGQLEWQAYRSHHLDLSVESTNFDAKGKFLPEIQMRSPLIFLLRTIRWDDRGRLIGPMDSSSVVSKFRSSNSDSDAERFFRPTVGRQVFRIWPGTGTLVTTVERIQCGIEPGPGSKGAYLDRGLGAGY